MSKHDIKHLLEHHAPQIRALGFESIGLFGSFSRGEETSESDIDVLYQFQDHSASLNAVLSLQEMLETHFNRSVHLVSAKYVHSLLKEDIFNETEWIWA